MATKVTKLWVTRDGREIPLDEMHTPHVGNAHAKIGKWLKGERDPSLRKDLRKWRGYFTKEIKQRQKEWLEKRNARK